MAAILSAPWPMALNLRTIGLVLGICSLLYVFCRCIYDVFFHPLAKVPGPKLYAASQLPYLYHIVKGDWHEVLSNFHVKYGPVVRCTYNDVSFITTDALKKIYGYKTGGEKTFEKDDQLYRPERNVRDIIRSSNEGHRRMRRLLAHAFSEKALRNQEDVIKKYVDLFIRRLTELAARGSVVDIVSWFNFATFDLIGDLAFGEPFGCLESGGYNPWVRMVFEGSKLVPLREVSARLGLESVEMIVTPSSVKRSAREHYRLTQQTALKRLRSQNMEKEDFMSYILRYNDERGMTEQEIIENSSVLIIAGSETTATLLSGTTFRLMTNRDKYDELVHEIRSAFQSEAEITISRVNELQYLIAVLSEGARMYPPVATALPRLTPEGGEFLDGYWIPENTTVGVSHWVAFRSAHNFRDPEIFAPERWLGDPKYANDDRAVVQPFSTGPRNCIGRNLAYAEMRLLLARLLWKFDLEMMPESKDWQQQRSYVLWEKGKLHVRLTEVARTS